MGVSEAARKSIASELRPEMQVADEKLLLEVSLQIKNLAVQILGLLGNRRPSFGASCKSPENNS